MFLESHTAVSGLCQVSTAELASGTPDAHRRVQRHEPFPCTCTGSALQESLCLSGLLLPLPEAGRHLSRAMCRPALHSSEMAQGKGNGHRDLGSRKHIPVLHSGVFPWDVIPNMK